MCEYCENGKVMLKREGIVNMSAWHWGWADSEYKITMAEAKKHTTTESLFIDRECLRLVGSDDSGCLEHGKRITIKYCPMCGDEIKER